MKKGIMRNRNLLKITVAFLLVFSFVGISHAKPQGSWFSDVKFSEFRPYLFATTGYGDLADDVFRDAFDTPVLRTGMGFGVSVGRFGMEAMVRLGESSSVYTIESDDKTTTTAERSMNSSEIQLRFYTSPRIGRFSFPLGIVFGWMNLDIDGGLPSAYDQHEGSGWYVGPYAGMDVQITKMVGLGVDLEYPFSDVSFGENADSYYGSSSSPQGIPSPTDATFWDTVAGVDDQHYGGGSWRAQIRLTVYLPFSK